MANENNAGAAPDPDFAEVSPAPTVDAALKPKRAAFIKWAAGRGLDVTEVRDAWGARRFLAPIIDGMWEGWFNAPAAPAATETSLVDLRDLLARAAHTGEAISLSPTAAGALHSAMTTPPDIQTAIADVMSEDRLQQLKTDAQALAADGANWSMDVGCMFVLAMIERIEAGAATTPASTTVSAFEQAPRLAGYIDRKDLVRLSNCRATIWPGTNEIDAVPVYLGAPPAPDELAAARKDAQRNERLFLAACGDLGLVSEALGLDPDDGGAAPIIAAIKALQAGVPAGWRAVPIVPTEDMVIDGFESVPDRHFDGDDYPEEYDAMSGCQQAAFRTKRCWAAMLEAAPAAGIAT